LFVYASEVATPTLAQIGSKWIDTLSVDPFVMNFVLAKFTGTSYLKTVYVQFADDAIGTSYNPTEAVSSTINLYQNVQLPVITYPTNNAEVTNRLIIVQGTCEPGATVRVTVEALS
jgi:hypothetical protein